MLTAEQTIRLILDAATADNFSAAIKALNDYADQRNSSKIVLNGNMNMEEVRKGFPVHPINEIP